MYALTLKQPFAQLVALGEIKSFTTTLGGTCRGRVLIYADKYPIQPDTADGKEMIEECEKILNEKPGILGVAVNDLPKGCLIGSVEIPDFESVFHADGSTTRTFAFAHPALLSEPVPCRRGSFFWRCDLLHPVVVSHLHTQNDEEIKRKWLAFCKETGREYKEVTDIMHTPTIARLYHDETFIVMYDKRRKSFIV